MWDISSTGAGLTCAAPLALNEVVQLRIGIGPGKTPQRCRVVRCDSLKDGTFSIGVEFLSASPRFLAQHRLSA